MQYPEFGTQVGRLKSLWLTLLGMTGIGQGASHSLPTAATLYDHGMSSAATSVSLEVISMCSAATGEGPKCLHWCEEPDWHAAVSARRPILCQ